jgi:hypothetical protein
MDTRDGNADSAKLLLQILLEHGRVEAVAAGMTDGRCHGEALLIGSFDDWAAEQEQAQQQTEWR